MPLRSFSQAEVLLTQRKRMEYPLLLLSWLGITAFSLASGSLFHLLAGTIAIAINLLAVRSAKEVYVTRFFVNVGVLAATGILGLEIWTGRENLLVSMGHYIVLIQLCKLFERKRNRDYVQILVLGMLGMVAATMLTAALWFAAVLVAYLALACYTTMVFTLKRDLDAAGGARLEAEAGPMAPQRVAWNVIRNWPARPLRRYVVGATAAVIAAGAMMFLFTPRADSRGRGAFPIRVPTAISGFSDDVRLGDVKEIRVSDAVVMEVRVEATAEHMRSLASGVYLRGRTYDVYSGSQWFRREADAPSALPVWTPPSPAGSIKQTSKMDRSQLPHMFTLYPSPGISADGAVRTNRLDLCGEIRVSGSDKGLVRYTAYAWPRPFTVEQKRWLRETYDYASDPAPSDRVRLPASVKQLALRWCADLLAERRQSPYLRSRYDRLIAERIAGRLRNEYEYTLDLRDAEPERDGIEDFLFHMKKGHCEYFAWALTAMCCSLDVRARLVTGYRGELDGDRCIVRYRDAHAWTEVFTPEDDWVVVDATPAGALGPPVGFWAGVGDLWSELQFFWYEKVVAFDATSQRDLAERARRWCAVRLGDLKDLAGALWRGLLKLLVHGYVDAALLRFVMVLAAVAAAVWTALLVRIVRQWRHRRRAMSAGQKAAYRQLAFAGKLFRLLARHGLKHRADQTPREVATAAAERFALPADVLGDLIDLYYRLRWGRQPQDAEEVRAAELRVAELGKRLRAARR